MQSFQLEFYLPDRLLPEKVGDDSRFYCDFLIEVLGNLIDHKLVIQGSNWRLWGSLCFFFIFISTHLKILAAFYLPKRVTQQIHSGCNLT